MERGYKKVVVENAVIKETGLNHNTSNVSIASTAVDSIHAA